MGKVLSDRSAKTERRSRWPASRVYLIASLILFAVLMSPFLNTILLAGICAFFLHPYVVRLRRRTRISTRRFLTAIFVAFFIVATLLSIGGAHRLVDLTRTNREWLSRIQIEFSLPERLKKEIIRRFPHQAEQVVAIAHDSIEGIKNFGVRAFQDFFRSVPFFLMNVVTFFVALHFFLVNSSLIKRRLMKMRLLPAQQFRFLVKASVEAARETFISVLVIGLIQTLIVTLGAWAVGFEHVLPVFLVTFTFSLIPLIGAGPVAFVVGLYLFFQNEVGRGIAMVVLSVLTGLVDNILRSFLMAKSNNMPATISFVCLIGAIIVFGFYGIFFGPFLGFLAAKFLTRRANSGTTLA